MLRITIESYRHDECVVQWVMDMLKFKSIPFKKHVIELPRKGEKALYEFVIEKKEREGES